MGGPMSCPELQPARTRSRLGFPRVHLTLRFLASDTIPLLYLSDELLTAALDLVDIVGGQFAPLFANRALELVPLASQRVLIHLDLPCT